MENTATSRGRGTFELLVQLITAAAVIGGIYLVMVELRQGREISTVEMIHKRFITHIEHDSKIYGETMSDTLSKACFKPETLTAAESTALEYYFQNRMRQIVITYTGATVGEFQKGIGLVENWRLLSEGYLVDIKSYAAGRNWIKTNPYWSDEERAKTDPLVAWVQSFDNETIPPVGCDRQRSFAPSA